MSLKLLIENFHFSMREFAKVFDLDQSNLSKDRILPHEARMALHRITAYDLNIHNVRDGLPEQLPMHVPEGFIPGLERKLRNRNFRIENLQRRLVEQQSDYSKMERTVLMLDWLLNDTEVQLSELARSGFLLQKQKTEKKLRSLSIAHIKDLQNTIDVLVFQQEKDQALLDELRSNA